MKINIKENLYGIDIDDLISIGYRTNNSKRNFLFISKILGKHIEVRPDMCKVGGLLLASTIFIRNDKIGILINYLKNQNDNEKLVKEALKLTYKNKEKIAILGFAETATGLGMAVASAIENSYYITTTREDIKDIKSLFNFQEEHSHATTHKCFPEEPNKLIEADRIILVDDEITTGRSILNIIKELIKVTNIRKYTVLTILDLRNIEYRNLYKEFSNENKIEINVNSLISGEVEALDNKIYIESEENEIEEITHIIDLNIMKRRGEYLKFTGKFGVNFKEILAIEKESIIVANRIQEIIGQDKKILVLGHGENIYIPSRIASYLKGDVYFKSTTRSPIYCSREEGYFIQDKNNFYHKGNKYYFYNKSSIEKNYDIVVLISEDDFNIKLTNNLLIIKP